MGDLLRILNEIKKDPKIREILFDDGFLNNVGNILENRGFEETKLFLWDSQFQENLEKQSIALLGILGKIEKLDMLRENRAISSHVIKNINSISKK